MYLHLRKSDAGTVPTYKKLGVGTVPLSKLLSAATVPASNYYKRRIMRTQSKGHLLILFQLFISRPKMENIDLSGHSELQNANKTLWKD